MQASQPLSIVVVGAGISGLTAAIALGKQGHRVVVLEKSKFNRETGAAINLAPNCTAVLEWLDIDPRQFGGTVLERMDYNDNQGNLKYFKDFSGVRQSWQAEYYLVHRADLHNALKDRARQTAEIHTGCKIVDIDISTNRPSVTLDDGRIFKGDLLIGADGLNSIVRNQIAPEASPPTPSDKSCFRWLLPASDLRQLAVTKDVVQPGVFIEWAAPKSRLVVYPCSDNEILNLCAFIPTADAGELGQGWESSGNKNALVNSFAEFSPAVREFIERADDDLKVWQLFDMEALPRWVTGRAALIGDSAHPFQPFLGQGGAMAIEDAVSLAILLPLGTALEDIPSRLSLYETARRPRVEMTLKYTRLNGRDEGDVLATKITAAEMVRFMEIVISHNEVVHSTAIMQDYLLGNISSTRNIVVEPRA
ncbi:hypothetical protein BDW59DRAFT_53118 [Aspergillus cavernicola]|uniref:FAD-binding domain-containing protein n=1 Tax=Aspergillus cavernicola TaxID=176166 RepID=A0ABR4IJJ6_9EURO